MRLVLPRFVRPRLPDRIGPQQLGVLRNEGVVNTRRDGKNIYYRVAEPGTLEMLALLYRLYCPDGES